MVTRFRNTIGLSGTLSVRLQPNDPADDPRGVAASTPDGVLLGAGDAVIAVNLATDNVETTIRLLDLLDTVRDRYAIPFQTCVLAPVTTTLVAIARAAPVDLVFQGNGGTEAVHRSFGVSLALLGKPRAAAPDGRGAAGRPANRGVIRRRVTPRRRRPSASAAACDTSTTRSTMHEPRSATVTTTDRALLRYATRARIPKGRVGCAVPSGHGSGAISIWVETALGVPREHLAADG